MSKNNKKKFKHTKRTEIERQSNEDASLAAYLAGFEHENIEIQERVRSLSNINVGIIDNPKMYDNSFSHKFYSMLWAQVCINSLMELRKQLHITAGQLDARLGYTVGYPMASFKNTRYKPTSKNVRIMSDVYNRMIKLFPRQMSEQRTSDRNTLIDVSQIVEDALAIDGVDFTKADTTEQEQPKAELEVVETETVDLIDGLELNINGTVISFSRNDNALEILQKIKTLSDVTIEVFETVKERVI